MSYTEGKLILRTIAVDNKGDMWITLDAPDQDDPGVPIADLVRECEQAERVIAALTIHGSVNYCNDGCPDYIGLKQAREAAAKPRGRAAIGITEHGDLVYALEGRR